MDQMLSTAGLSSEVFNPGLVRKFTCKTLKLMNSLHIQILRLLNAIIPHHILMQTSIMLKELLKEKYIVKGITILVI